MLYSRLFGFDLRLVVRQGVDGVNRRDLANTTHISGNYVNLD
jgi:hypothetical protein